MEMHHSWLKYFPHYFSPHDCQCIYQNTGYNIIEYLMETKTKKKSKRGHKILLCRCYWVKSALVKYLDVCKIHARVHVVSHLRCQKPIQNQWKRCKRQFQHPPTAPSNWSKYLASCLCLFNHLRDFVHFGCGIYHFLLAAFSVSLIFF